MVAGQLGTPAIPGESWSTKDEVVAQSLTTLNDTGILPTSLLIELISLLPSATRVDCCWTVLGMALAAS